MKRHFASRLLVVIFASLSGCGTGDKNPAPDSSGPVVLVSHRSAAYADFQEIALDCEDEAGGCVIHYTLDGRDPSTDSPVYNSPLLLEDEGTYTIKFFAVDAAGNASEIASATIVIDKTAPSVNASLDNGYYDEAKTLSLTCNDGAGSGCAYIRYTADGSEPNDSSAIYEQSLEISGQGTTVVTYFAADNAGNIGSTHANEYVIDTSAPRTGISTPSGIYAASQTVLFNCTDIGGSGCKDTYYTTDGTTPTPNSPVADGALTIDTSTVLQFFSVDTAGNEEQPRQIEIVLDRAAPATRAAPAGGIYNRELTVDLTCTDTGGGECQQIRFTTDESDPKVNGTLYDLPITVSDRTTVKFYAIDNAGNAEVTQSLEYVVDLSPPAASVNPAQGLYNETQQLSLSCTDEGGSGCGTMYYTLDGQTPSQSSNIYSGPLTLETNTTLRYFAVDNAGNIGSIENAIFHFDTQPPVSTISPAKGPIAPGTIVTLTCEDGTGSGCADIYYTLDGSTPTSYSAVYEAPINLTESVTIRFFSTDVAGNHEPSQRVDFAVDVTPPTTLPFPRVTKFNSPRDVRLECSDGSGARCDAIYYTLDGSEPTTQSTQYAGPITITDDTTLKYFSMDTVGNAESTRTEHYSVTPIVAEAGTNYTAVIASDDTVWVLPGNNLNNSSTFEQVFQDDGTDPLSDVVALAITGSFNLALKDDGTVWAWGHNDNGQLGTGDQIAREHAVQVILEDGTPLRNIVSIDAQYWGNASYALAADGTVWAWGGSGRTQLGIGVMSTDVLYPSKVKTADGDIFTGVRRISAGPWHVLAIKNDGSIWGWGGNNAGQVDPGNGITHFFPIPIFKPNGIPFTDAVAISAGGSHSLALLGDGSVWAWGGNDYGELGHLVTRAGRRSPSPVLVEGEPVTGVTAIDAGYSHSVALLSDGGLLSWGMNILGQVGNGTRTTSLPPTPVITDEGAPLNRAAMLSAGQEHTVAVLSDGALVGWGDNGIGQLGQNRVISSAVPTQVLEVNNAVEVAAGGGSNAAVSASGTVWTWGYNGDGQLGTTAGSSNADDLRDRSTPQLVADASGTALTDINQVAIGIAHMLARTVDGTILSWGKNGLGQLGRGSRFDLTPQPEPGFVLHTDGSIFSDVSLVGAGSLHSLAIKTDGTVWGWGYNDSGQLNIQTSSPRERPIQVCVSGDEPRLVATGSCQGAPLTNVIDVAAGRGHSVALKEDGTVWTWGTNALDQLGNGTGNDSIAPVQVMVDSTSPLTDITQVRALDNSSAALDSNGTVWIWGAYGQGDSLNALLHYATQVESADATIVSETAAVAVGGGHKLVLRNDGLLLSWGDNQSGQLGDANSQTVPYPAVVPNLPLSQINIIGIAAGQHHSLALTDGGTILAWGSNVNSELGRGDDSIIDVATSIATDVFP